MSDLSCIYNSSSILEKFDTVPTHGSTNLVDSGAVKDFVDNREAYLQNQINNISVFVNQFPEKPSSDGNYVLKGTVTNGQLVMYWGTDSPGPGPTPSGSYIVFSSLQPFTLGLNNASTYGPGWDGTIEYSLDKTTWITWDKTSISALSSNNDNEIYLRGVGNTTMWQDSPRAITNFVITATSGVQCSGNIETLLDYQTVLNGLHPAMSSGCFNKLFYGCTSLTTAPQLPATTLVSSCYNGMFDGCTSLTTAPQLPATTLANSCYMAMFRDCTSLTAPPALPATTLAVGCYDSMFDGCTSLTTAPQLSATTLTESCYSSMFRDCTALALAPALPASTMEQTCYSHMFSGCTSLTTPPVLSATTLAIGCYQYMFWNCTSLTSAPALPASTLQDSCYSYMFKGCSSLKFSDSITVIYRHPFPIPSTSSQNTTVEMFEGTGGPYTNDPIPGDTYYTENPLVPRDPELGFLIFYSSNPFSVGIRNDLLNGYAPSWNGVVQYSTDGVTWTNWDGSSPVNSVSQSSQPQLYLRGTGNTQFVRFDSSLTFDYWHTVFELTSSSNSGVGCLGNIETLLDYQTVLNGGHPTVDQRCFENLFAGCTSLIQAPDLTANISFYCFHSMFSGCTSLTTAPELPATTLAPQCYEQMFSACTSLTTAPALPATTLTISCYKQMFANCTALTTAPTLPATTLVNGCYDSMFRGCTSLTSAPSLPATTLASECYGSMFFGCTSLTAAPALPATTLAGSCYQGMFNGCTSLVSVPSSLPATTLEPSCYMTMFQDCTSLTSTPSLPATTLANSCYESMFKGCTSLTVSPSLPATTLASSCYKSMLEGCSSLIYAPGLTATTLQDYCYERMFYGCNALELSSTQDSTYRYPMYIPNSSATDPVSIMFAYTGGPSHPNTPVLGNTYYFKKPLVPANPTPTLGYITLSSTAPFTLGTSYSTVGDVQYAPSWDGTMEYSTDTTTWTTWTGQSISSSSNNTLYLRGRNNTTFTTLPKYTNFTLASTSSVSCSGSIETLLDYPIAAVGIHPSMGLACFTHLFEGCASLATAPSLPATILETRCYEAMFKGCTSLSTSPSLPAMTLADRCYMEMFEGCVSLTTPPSLPATTLGASCYNMMFGGCTSLSTAPSLPATTVTGGCYTYMFLNCRSLTTAPALPANNTMISCYSGMFMGCTSLTTPPALPATTMSQTCYAHMFQGCTSLVVIPAFPAAAILAVKCYEAMFNGCSQLKISNYTSTTYQYSFQIPSSTETDVGYGMFFSTGGDYTGDGTPGSTYFTDHPLVT